MKKIFTIATVPAIFALLVVANLNLISCTKTDTNTVTVRDTTYTTVYDTTIIKDTITTGPSILSMLTGKQWEFDTAYLNYTGPGTGSLVYVRGATNNVEDLDDVYTSYTADGFYWALQGTFYSSGQWHFTNNDSSTYVVNTATFGSDYVRIIKLTDSICWFYDSTGSALDIEKVTPP
jgi:hypothetical protein